MIERETSVLKSFFHAIRNGTAEEVAVFLDRDPGLVDGFDPDPWCCRGTPLNVAVTRGDAQLVGLLLERGADPDRKSDWWAGGFAALHSIRRANREKLLPMLLEAEAVVDEHAAAQHGLADELAGIIDRWPMRVNAPGGDGARPLHFADNRTIAAMLLDRGAWIDAPDVDHGSTPAQWAVSERPDVTRFLLERGAAADPFMFAALDDGSAIRDLLDSDPGLTGARLAPEAFPSPGSKAGHMYCYNLGGYGSMLIHVAARTGALAVLRALIDAGADLAATGGSGEPAPLHSAACADRVEAVRILVAAGAPIDQLSGEPHHSSALVWARACGAARAERALLDLGAREREHS